ncbi:MAG: D-aminoacyl-tRNA deacylase [Actinobacteria bacterium]|nr:D-aminoacyl-tRNA deacylase [Actinomycetota bacterium]
MDRYGRFGSSTDAADPTEAEPLYERFCEALGCEVRVSRGLSGVPMDVMLVNEGPVTIVLDM